MADEPSHPYPAGLVAEVTDVFSDSQLARLADLGLGPIGVSGLASEARASNRSGETILETLESRYE